MTNRNITAEIAFTEAHRKFITAVRWGDKDRAEFWAEKMVQTSSKIPSGMGQRQAAREASHEARAM